MRRRDFVCGAAALGAATLAPPARAQSPATVDAFAELVEEARSRAARGWEPRPVPDGLRGVDRGLVARARPRREHLRELGAGYVLAPLPPGGDRNGTAAIRLLRGESAELLPFFPDMFDEPGLAYPSDLPPETGFAGLALMFPLNAPPALDEFMRFGNASLVRGVGRGGIFGSSARAVAVDTSNGRGEEFPAFVEYRIDRPQPDSRALPVYALLDGPSVTGAFAFLVQPGITTVAEVEGVLFVRDPGHQIGLAPIGGMFLHGSHDPPAGLSDVRPRVHGCEGLAIWRGNGERVWRPLANPRAVRLNVFPDESPRGFGLQQRARGVAAYGDLEARYDLEPNLWVEPLADWGRGALHLVEIPLADPAFSNIAVFWEPERELPRGEPLHLAYRLSWSLDLPAAGGLAPVRETRVGAAIGPGGEPRQEARRIEIDFATQPQPGAAPEAELEAKGARIVNRSVTISELVGGTRVGFEVEPAEDGPVELRCVLRDQSGPLSETWLFRLDDL